MNTSIAHQFYVLMKPRVIQLIVFCALIGMVLAVPGVPSWEDVRIAAVACFGIWLVAGAAAAFNCLVEKGIDAKMRRHRIGDLGGRNAAQAGMQSVRVCIRRNTKELFDEGMNLLQQAIGTIARFVR